MFKLHRNEAWNKTRLTLRFSSNWLLCSFFFLCTEFVKGERKNWRDLGVDGRMIVIHILERYGTRLWTHLIGPG
jgi:hypothetical protein